MSQQVAVVDEKSISKPTVVCQDAQWLKVMILLSWVGVMFGGWYFLVWQVLDWPNSVKLLIFGVLCIVTFGMIKNNGLLKGLPYLAANKESIFLVHKPMERQFLKLPWGVVKELSEGIFGLNKRGIQVVISAAALDELNKNMISQSPCVYFDSDVRIIVPSGIAKRMPLIAKLNALRSQANAGKNR